MKEISIPSGYDGRLAAVAKQHKFADAKAVAKMFVEKGLAALGAPEGKSLDAQMAAVVDSHGYSSKEELVEHLLERGLGAYENADADPEKFKARLRGLGYID
ncbi:MAG TPA: hypothetical protein VHB21_01460 [Minicystis sp.]|nr:hypothetical protein [Minicystis sp.]